MFKCSFIYNTTVDGARAGGWTTNFWNQGTDLDSVLAAAKKLQPLLCRCCGDSVYVKGVRVSDINNARNARTITFATQAKAGFDDDYPSTAVHLTLYGTTIQPVSIWLRGIPDDAVKAGVLVAGFEKQFPAFTDLVTALATTNNGWCIQRVNSAQKYFDITAYNNLNLAIPQFVTTVANGFVQGDVVRIARVKGFPYLKRTWKVLAVMADGVTVNFGPNYNPPAAVPTITSKGQVRKVTPTGAGTVMKVEAITKTTFDYATKHNVGRPPKLLSGRRGIKR